MLEAKNAKKGDNRQRTGKAITTSFRRSSAGVCTDTKKTVGMYQAVDLRLAHGHVRSNPIGSDLVMAIWGSEECIDAFVEPADKNESLLGWSTSIINQLTNGHEQVVGGLT